MNITRENIDELNAVLKVKVGPEDYQARVESALKDYQKKVQMPGFRPGKVPTGMIKKMYGKSILVDEINKLLSDSLYSYIRENNIDILGNPLPKMEEAAGIDWDNQKEFEFSYDLGLAPQFEVSITANDKFPMEVVKVDDTLIDKYVNDIRKSYGKPGNPEVSEANDLLFGDFVELDANGDILAGGIFKSSSIAIDRLSNEEIKSKLTGLKRDDKVVLEASKLSANTTDLAAMLGIEKAQAETIKSSFQFTVKNIARMEPAPVDQQLFDRVYGPGKVTTEEEFRGKISEELSNMFRGEAERKLKNKIEEALLEKVNVSLPDDFLKKWLVAANEKPVTYEQVSAEYDQYSKGLKWQLIENKLLKDNEIKVSHEDALAYTKSLVNSQFMRYGKMDVDDEELTSAANEILKKESEAKRIYDNLYSARLMDVLKSKVTIEEKEVSYEDFYKN
jgi:trigger factor